jgi:hypothetical protein
VIGGRHVIKLRWEYDARHARCFVFACADREHLALVGQLVLDHGEAIAFRQTVRQGVTGRAGAFAGIFEAGWPDELEAELAAIEALA